MKTKKIIITCLVIGAFLGFAHNNAHGVEPNLPDDFPEFIINQYGETAPGYIYGSVVSENPNVGDYFVMLDNAGTVIFYSQTQSLGRLMCNGLFKYRTPIPGMRKKVIWHLQDENFNDVDTFKAGNGYYADGHDFQVLPNGHVLILIYDNHIIDMSQIVEGGHPAASVGGAVIQELDVNKNVIFQWRSIDYIPITDSYRNIKRSRFGYIHVNSVELDETDGNIILCCRETSEAIKISRVTGEVIWRMTGKQNEFTFINEHPENAPLYFRVAHDIRRHANGHLTIFDNGNDMQIGGGRTYSRVVEYDLDEVNKTATMVWEYRNDPDYLALHGGACIRLPNGNTIIHWGGATEDGEAPLMQEVDPNENSLFEIWPAQEDVLVEYPAGLFKRVVLPLEDQCTTVTRSDLMEGNEYVFNDTGVTLKVNSLDGQANNEVSVKRASFGPLYPEFGGKAPRVLPVRVKVDESGIESTTAGISFDAENFGFADSTGQFCYADPDKLTIHHRPVPGQGLFTPLPTDYNPVTRQLSTIMTEFGEFIFCFPDLEEVPYAPLLIEPEDQGTVNQELPVSFVWSPRGFYRSFGLQVAKDPEFKTLVADEPNLKETRYTLENLESETTYYYRVNTTNYGGTGEWATASFATAAPMIEVTAPNGGEQWKRGLDFFILWKDNIDEDVTLELYKGNTFLRTIRTVSSIGAYEWEVDLDLEPGCDYSIQVKSSENEAIFDMSDEVFAIDPPDTTPPEFELSVTPDILWPPTHKMVLITPSWTVSDDVDPSPEVSLVSIVANEGDNTIGDGHTSGDIQIGEDGSIHLRSERSGPGTDRVYTITYEAVDDCGNVTVSSATVSIPHDFRFLAKIASRWLWSGPAGRIPEDLNGDGTVNLMDIAKFAEN
ncbi:MAG: hypothetical protein GWN94_23620 [Phycisphaerae bacterium]|nr:hypothetical protein [Phycisphaerae bacterium]NIX02615.1 hypothetical protein [Phycisphaerae bacterium]